MMDSGTDISTIHHKDVHGYFLALQKYFNDAETKHDRSNSPRAQKARAKLLKLSASQFYELSTDVYDELQRRVSDDQSQPEYLLPRATFHMKRNQARQKLANLSRTRFNDLVDDILFEIKRRGYNVAPEKDAADNNKKTHSGKSANSEKKKDSHSSANTKSSVSDASLSQIPPTATIQTSKVIPQKASIDWSSEEEEHEELPPSGEKNKPLVTRDALEENERDTILIDKNIPPRINGLQQPDTTPILSATESYHYGDLIDSPAPTEIGNPINEDTPKIDLNDIPDLEISQVDEMGKDNQKDRSAQGVSSDANQNRMDQLNDEIEALKKENATLRQNRSLGGFTSNENFERDLNSLSAELGTLSVENEELREKVSELEFKTKNVNPKQLTPLKTKHTEMDSLKNRNLLDREFVAQYAAEDGSIPFESVEEFHNVIEKLFENVQSCDDDIGRTLFENLARLSHMISQVLLLVDVPDFKDQVLLLRASLSHTITAIRYYAVYGALLPNITVQAALSELAFSFCNLIRACRIKSDGQSISKFGRKLATLDSGKMQSPQTPDDIVPYASFKSSSMNNPSEITNFEGSAQDDVSPVKPLKITQKANTSPQVKTPSSRKFSGGLLFGSTVTTKSPASQLNGSNVGNQFDKVRELNSVSPTYARTNGSNVGHPQLRKLAELNSNPSTSSEHNGSNAGFSLEKTKDFQEERTSPKEDGHSKDIPHKNNSVDAKLSNGEPATLKKLVISSRSTTADEATALPTPPSSASPSESVGKSFKKKSVRNVESYSPMDKHLIGKGNSSQGGEFKPAGAHKSNHSRDGQPEAEQLKDQALPQNSNSKSSDESDVKEAKGGLSSSRGHETQHPGPSKGVKPSAKDTKDTTPVQDSKSKSESEKPLEDSQSKPPSRQNKPGKPKQEDANVYKLDQVEGKLKRGTGKSFTDKLRTFANNAGIGLRVDKDSGGPYTKDGSPKVEEHKPGGKKFSSNERSSERKKSTADSKSSTPTNKSKGFDGAQKSNTTPSSITSVNGTNTHVDTPGSKHEDKRSPRNGVSPGEKLGHDVVGSGHSSGTKKEVEVSGNKVNSNIVKPNGTGKKPASSPKSNVKDSPNDAVANNVKKNGGHNGILPSFTLNDDAEETEISPKGKMEFSGAKKADVGNQKSDEASEKLPNFYFNNIPVPPTNSLVTDKLKKSFADIPSEDENGENSDINNSPYLSDDGSAFHAFKQSWREENTGRKSPLVQEQNFHKGESAAKGLSGGAKLKNGGDTANGNPSMNGRNNKYHVHDEDHVHDKDHVHGNGTHSRGHTASGAGKSKEESSTERRGKSSTLSHGGVSEESSLPSNPANPKRDGVKNHFLGQGRYSEDDRLHDMSQRDQKGSLNKNDGATAVHSNTSFSASEGNLHSSKAQDTEGSDVAPNRSMSDPSAKEKSAASKSGGRLVTNENRYNKSRGYDPSGSPALPGIIGSRSEPNGKQASKNDLSEDLNVADHSPSTQNGDAKKAFKPAHAAASRIQPVKLNKSHSTNNFSDHNQHRKPGTPKDGASTTSPAIPKTPVVKSSPTLKTPVGKSSATPRSPALRSTAGRSPAGRSPDGRYEYLDDEIMFDVDSFDISNPDNTLSELLLYLEHQSLQVIATIQSLLTSIKEPHATKGNLRRESNAINEVIRQMVDATSVSMNQSRNASLKEHGSWVIKSLEDCYLRMTTLCQLGRGGKFTDKTGDDEFADKHFKQRLAGIAFDVAKCTKELVKTVEEASLKEEIAFLNSRLN